MFSPLWWLCTSMSPHRQSPDGCWGICLRPGAEFHLCTTDTSSQSPLERCKWRSLFLQRTSGQTQGLCWAMVWVCFLKKKHEKKRGCFFWTLIYVVFGLKGRLTYDLQRVRYKPFSHYPKVFKTSQSIPVWDLSEHLSHIWTLTNKSFTRTSQIFGGVTVTTAHSCMLTLCKVAS